MQQDFNRFKAEQGCVRSRHPIQAVVDLGAYFFWNHTFKINEDYFVQKHLSETLSMGCRWKLLIYVSGIGLLGRGGEFYS